MARGRSALAAVPPLGVYNAHVHRRVILDKQHVTGTALTSCRAQEGTKAAAPAPAVPRGLPALPAIPALGLYEMPQIELPRNWLDIFAPLPAPKPEAPASAPGLAAPIQYNELPALPSGHRKMLQAPGQGMQASAAIR